MTWATISGTPYTLRRQSAAVADLAGLWQRALSGAVEAAQASHSDAETRLSRLKSQLELRSYTLSQREVDIDKLLRSRERIRREPEEHLRASLSMPTKRVVTTAALKARLAAARQETENYQVGLAKVIQRTATRHHAWAVSVSAARFV